MVKFAGVAGALWIALFLCIASTSNAKEPGHSVVQLDKGVLRLGSGAVVQISGASIGPNRIQIKKAGSEGPGRTIQAVQATFDVLIKNRHGKSDWAMADELLASGLVMLPPMKSVTMAMIRLATAPPKELGFGLRFKKHMTFWYEKNKAGWFSFVPSGLDAGASIGKSIDWLKTSDVPGLGHIKSGWLATYRDELTFRTIRDHVTLVGAALKSESASLAYVRRILEKSPAASRTVNGIRFIVSEAREIHALGVSKALGLVAFKFGKKWILGGPVQRMRFSTPDTALAIQYFDETLTQQNAASIDATVANEIFNGLMREACERARTSYCVVMAIRPFEKLSGMRLKYGFVYRKTGNTWSLTKRGH